MPFGSPWTTPPTSPRLPPEGVALRRWAERPGSLTVYGANGWGCETTAASSKYVSSVTTDTAGVIVVTADRAAETLSGELAPIDDVRSTAEYRRLVAARVLHRLIREAGGW